jgi:hypothetical protein
VVRGSTPHIASGVAAIHIGKTASNAEIFMPNWLGPLLALCALVGFIGFAFYQGTKVKPDGSGNPDNSVGADGGNTSHGGADGSRTP